MYDKGKVITGLVLFFLFFTLPFWWNHGKAKAVPEPELNTPVIEEVEADTGEKHCVGENMKAQHMQILNEWRISVVRDADRMYAYKGTRYDMSLSNTCMNCHSNKAKFCDKCHDYTGITPYCWDCHVEPKEEQDG